MTNIKNVVLPISENIKVKPLTAESIGSTDQAPVTFTDSQKDKYLAKSEESVAKDMFKELNLEDSQSIGVVGHMPLSPEPVNLEHVQISSALRERMEKIRFASDEKTNTDKTNKPQ